jgi:hypothetical protein
MLMNCIMNVFMKAPESDGSSVAASNGVQLLHGTDASYIAAVARRLVN